MKKVYLVPALLLVYLTGIAIYAYPGHREDISWGQYVATICVTLVCILLLTYFLKKKKAFRDEARRRRKEKE